MTRPNTLHKGFFVPNASGVLDPVMSEPDQIDYNIAGNARWGVVIGCEVTVSTGTTAEITAGIAVVDGQVVHVAGGQTIQLGSGTSQARFDLVGVNAAGLLTVVVGAPSSDPTFPDPPPAFTALAAVLAPSGISSFGEYVVDKRHFLQTVLAAAGTGNITLILNRDGLVDSFRVAADGRHEWNDGDTTMRRKSAGVLEVGGVLDVTGNAVLRGDAQTYGAANVDGLFTSRNFQRNAAFPSSADNGTMLVRDGLPYMRRAGTWEQMLTTGTGGDQVGDIKQSMRTPSEMPGWLRLTGQIVQESDSQYTQLFTVGGLAQFITGTAPNRLMTLPDATNRFLLGGNAPGEIGGVDSISVGMTNMPAHDHEVSVLVGGEHSHGVNVALAGGHQHWTLMTPRNPGAPVTSNGGHTHAVSDPGHSHEGAEPWAGLSNWGFVALAWGGTNKIDGPIGDASHSYSVEAMPRTARGTTNIAVSAEGSEHAHLTDIAAAHTHATSVVAGGLHVHPITQSVKGGGQPISVRPRYMTVFTYVKL